MLTSTRAAGPRLIVALFSVLAILAIACSGGDDDDSRSEDGAPAAGTSAAQQGQEEEQAAASSQAEAADDRDDGPTITRADVGEDDQATPLRAGGGTRGDARSGTVERGEVRRVAAPDVRVASGWGRITLSADRASGTPGFQPTELPTLELEFGDITAVRPGSTIVLQAPSGINFSSPPRPTFSVGGGRIFNADDEECSGSWDAVQGDLTFPFPTIVWTASEVPDECASGTFLVSIRGVRVSLGSPTDVASKGGDLLLTGSLMRQPVVVTVGEVVAGPGRPDVSQSSVTLEPTTIVADERDAATLTVVVRDAHGNPIPTRGAVTVSSSLRDTKFTGLVEGPDGGVTTQLIATSAGFGTVEAFLERLPLGVVDFEAQGVLVDLDLKANGGSLAEVNEGDVVELVIELTNLGPADATGLVITVPIPDPFVADLVLEQNIGGTVAVNGGVLTWSDPVLPAGASGLLKMGLLTDGGAGSGNDIQATITASAVDGGLGATDTVAVFVN